MASYPIFVDRYLDLPALLAAQERAFKGRLLPTEKPEGAEWGHIYIVRFRDDPSGGDPFPSEDWDDAPPNEHWGILVGKPVPYQRPDYKFVNDRAYQQEKLMDEENVIHTLTYDANRKMYKHKALKNLTDEQAGALIGGFGVVKFALTAENVRKIENCLEWAPHMSQAGLEWKENRTLRWCFQGLFELRLHAGFAGTIPPTHELVKQYREFQQWFRLVKPGFDRFTVIKNPMPTSPTKEYCSCDEEHCVIQ